MNYDIHKICSGLDLPILQVTDQLCKELHINNTLILHAPPGAGKSTLVPLTLLNEPWLHGKKIIMLEPRRLAARTIAHRMSDLLGEKVGQTVGYRVRFDNCISTHTRIEIVTEGILTRMLQTDNALEDFGCVIFDEFHERSIFADIALALSRESQSILRPELRLLIMSATLDIPELQSKLNAPLVESLGKQYPVEIEYIDRHDERMIPELVAQTILEALPKHNGDVLAFIPGEAEIRRCETILKQKNLDVAIYPLFGQLPQKLQHQALRPHPDGKRKIVLATSIAETSLTIEGVKLVVDAGYVRTSKFDSRTGLPRLQTIEITQDAAAQRAGRAGRLSPGHCIRLWSKAKHDQLKAHRMPEIESSDLCNLVLDLAAWGTQNTDDLMWLSPPPHHAVSQAKATLLELGAIATDEKITHHGEAIHKLPCHPRIAHMLLCAQSQGTEALACDLAALMEERDPLGKEFGIDINIRIETLRRQRRDQKLSKAMRRIEKISQSYRQILKIDVSNKSFDSYETGFLLVHAFPERIACARPGNNAQFQLSNGTYASASHNDDLAHEPWLAIAHMNLRDRNGKIFLAAPLNPTDLAPLVKNRELVEWDTRNQELVAETQLRIGTIILQKKPLKAISAELKAEAICKAIQKAGAHMLNFDATATQLQNRVQSIQTWTKDDTWPNFSTKHLIKNVHTWLPPYFQNIKNGNDLKRLNISDILISSLSWELQQALNRLVPERIEVPSGSKIKIEYQADASSPILSVRLQEMFGLMQTPTVNNGQTPMLLHLLSPGYKPIQITTDLESFWNNTYFEVKKELKRRYPKHAWPDDPINEAPRRGVKRKK